MGKAQPVVVFIILMVASSGFVLFGFSHALSTPGESVRFSAWQQPAPGFVQTFSQVNNSLPGPTSTLNNTSIVVWSGVLPKPNSNLTQRLATIENSSLVVFEISKSEPVSLVLSVAKEGFQGIFLSGSPGNANLSQIKQIANATTSMGGFLIVNESLAGTVQGVSTPSAYYIFQPNYLSWINFIRQNSSTAASYKNYWVNIQHIDNTYMEDAVKTFEALGVSYISIDFGHFNYSQTRKVIALESSSGTGPGIVPSNWHLSNSNPPANEPVVDGTLFTIKSNIPMRYAMENSTGPGNFTFHVMGVNTTYGFVSYLSQNYTIYASLNGTLLAYAQTAIAVSGGKVYAIAMAEYYNFNFTSAGEILLHTAVFSLSNGTLLSTRLNRLPTLSDFPPLIFVAGKSIVFISSYYNTTSPNQNWYYTINATIVNMTSGGIVGTTQFGSPPASIGLENGWGAYFDFISGTLLQFTVTYKGNYSITYSYLLYLPNDTVLVSSVNATVGNHFYEAKGNLFFTDHNASGGTNVNELNLTTLHRTTLFTTYITPIDSLYFFGTCFLVYSNGTMIALALDGSEMWNESLPEVMPPGYGFNTAPIPVGNGDVLVGSVIGSESVFLTFYSQVFVIVNLTTGQVVATYYNNFTITPIGNPPGLPPSPDVYAPLTWTGNVLIYDTIWGTPELYGAYL